MSGVLTVAALFVGGVLWSFLDHYLRVRRATMALGRYPNISDEPSASEARMSYSQQQLQTLGLSRVRKVVATGEFTAADVAKWKKELGDEPVNKIITAAEAERPGKKQAAKASSPAPTSKDKE